MNHRLTGGGAILFAVFAAGTGALAQQVAPLQPAQQQPQVQPPPTAPAAAGTPTSASPQPPPEPPETPIGTEANTPVPALPRRRFVRPTSVKLKLATWHFKATKSEGAAQASSTSAPAATPQKKWRHTFGAERTTSPWRNIKKAGFAADIIALQGVRSHRQVRRLFNARHYHVVTSRQLLSRSIATSTGIPVFRQDAPLTTAVAFRRRRGVRIAGFRHFLPKSGRNALKPEPPAITAFRLRSYRKMLWIASLDIPAACKADFAADECRPHAPVVARFTKWAKRVGRQKTPLLLLGRWPESLLAKLKDAGLEERTRTGASIDCTPTPSEAVLAVPTQITAETGKLAGATSAKFNACVVTAYLELNLR